MTELVMFVGIMMAMILGIFNQKWYTKLLGVLGGLFFAALPFIFILLFATKQ